MKSIAILLLLATTAVLVVASATAVVVLVTFALTTLIRSRPCQCRRGTELRATHVYRREDGHWRAALAMPDAGLPSAMS